MLNFSCWINLLLGCPCRHLATISFPFSQLLEEKVGGKKKKKKINIYIYIYIPFSSVGSQQKIRQAWERGSDRYSFRRFKMNPWKPTLISYKYMCYNSTKMFWSTHWHSIYLCIWVKSILSFQKFSKDRWMDLGLNYTSKADLSSLIRLITYREWWWHL